MSQYLLDTDIILWLAENSANLSDAVKAIILDESNVIRSLRGPSWPEVAA
jgi:PIN domain nuclease of toxin-antitoxin system